MKIIVEAGSLRCIRVHPTKLFGGAEAHPTGPLMLPRTQPKRRPVDAKIWERWRNRDDQYFLVLDALLLGRFSRSTTPLSDSLWPIPDLHIRSHLHTY